MRTKARSASRKPVSKLAHISLLASPVRQEIMDTLSALDGDAPISAIAEHLGRPADALYYHIRLLERAGLLVESETSTSVEKRYRFHHEYLPRLKYELDDRRNAAAVRKVARGLLNIAQRDFDAALGRPGVQTAPGPRRELWASRTKGWLSSQDLAEANRLLERLVELTSQPRTPNRDRLASLAFMIAPLDAKPRRR